MMSLDFDQDSFYICTETSPRCFVVQKAIQIDPSQIDRIRKVEKGELSNSGITAPPAPPMPVWFDEDCRRELMMAGDELGVQHAPHCTDLRMPLCYDMAVGPPSEHPPAFNLENVKAMLKAQLEYYFSRENLQTDRYLRCQMDTDNFVPISIIAGFRKISSLTSDYALIVQTLRESSVVEVDEAGLKVRPVSKRCTIILREIDQSHAEEVEEMLSGGPPYVSLTYGLNDSWYVTYATEELTQQAYLHLQRQDRPICARIKTGAPPDTHLLMRQPPPKEEKNAEDVSVFDLGKVLASMGFTPRATYRPGTTVVQVHEAIPPQNCRSPRPQGGDYPRRGGGGRNGAGGGYYGGGNGRGGRGRGGGHYHNVSNGVPPLQSLHNGYNNARSDYSDRRRHSENGGAGPQRKWQMSEGSARKEEDDKREEKKEERPPTLFNYEETSFPSLVEDEVKPEPKKEKLSFSSVAAGRKEEKKKKSYKDSLLSNST